MKTLWILVLSLLLWSAAISQKAWVGKIDEQVYFATLHSSPLCPLAPLSAALIPLPPPNDRVPCPMCWTGKVTFRSGNVEGSPQIEAGMTEDEVFSRFGRGEHTMHVGDFDSYEWNTATLRMLVQFENGRVRSFYKQPKR